MKPSTLLTTSLAAISTALPTAPPPTHDVDHAKTTPATDVLPIYAPLIVRKERSGMCHDLCHNYNKWYCYYCGGW
ncbi:hypothetical protein BDU57DRAFT_524923 [Ampelomyces quisqualis]|uniref:Invertebrate defensins family profile domain-containing protein n=1 Tax=Ampelomyces quisqualis TaxID=50730 RepID=A0A6A5Q6K0_AMPQU|nr:hypothetical protein BDU57DRAFT_524923 [Ampelomyces quisqualis]